MKNNFIKLIKLIFFLIFSWLVANSLLFTLLLSFPTFSTPESYLEAKHLLFFPYYIIKMWIMIIPVFFKGIPFTPQALSIPVGGLLMAIYGIIILFYPCLLFYRKMTVFRAWILAMSAIILPPYYKFFREDIEYTLAVPIMTATYGLIWLTLRFIKWLFTKMRPNDRSHN